MRSIILLSIVIFLAATFRFVNLGSNPPSLYWDEVSQAYNSYSILKTGYDEHHEFLPIARFQAFGDYKAPVYIYLTVPSIALFGLTEFAVRFPSALFGTLTVLISYFLVLQLFTKEKNKYNIAIFTAFLLAVSPWHIQLSRVAYEANIATFFTVLGLMFFFIARNRNAWIYTLCSLSLVVGFYAFNAHRVFIPLITFLLALIYIKDLKKNLPQILVSISIAVVLLMPFLLFLKTPESKLRFNEVNIFSDSKIIEESNDRIEYSGGSFFSKIFDNRRVLFGTEYIRHYLDFWNPKYLFISGDGNPRFSLQDNGIFYIWEIPLLISGFYILIKRKDKTSLFLIGWVLLAPIGSATARETPHALRALTYIPTFQIVGGIGAIYLFNHLREFLGKKIIFNSVVGLFIFFIISSIILFLHNYFSHFPTIYAEQWQYGYKEAVIESLKIESKYDRIIMTTRYGRPYIYVLFYSGLSPDKYWRTSNVKKDSFGFYDVYSLGKYYFVGTHHLKKYPVAKTLYIINEEEVFKNMRIIKKINFPNGNNAFVFAERTK